MLIQRECPALNGSVFINQTGCVVVFLGKKRTIKNDLTAYTAPITFACPCHEGISYILDPEVHSKKAFEFMRKKKNIVVQ